jgi:hypothetical protein
MWRDWLWFVFCLAAYLGGAVAIGLLLAGYPLSSLSGGVH